MSEPWIVLKFGGTSVATAERWGVIAARVRALRETSSGAPPRILVVVSALAGVSDRLFAALREAREKPEPTASARSAAPALEWIRAAHEQLARELGATGDEWAPVEELFEELTRLLEGVRLTEEATPRLIARVLSFGELASTRLGLAALRRHGVEARWLDVREVLLSDGRPNEPEERAFLEAHVPITHAPERLESRVDDAGVVLTQGFLARTRAGDTCLLGRGGSDTSGALLAALLGAARLEIWTDVPGMFTADPRAIPSARLLRRLDYRTAQELAAMGAKVLHPRCLPPVAQYEIPLEVRSTMDPDAEGTLIAPLRDDRPSVTAVTCRRDVTLVSLSTLSMWETPGFLARAFACFEAEGISIDLVATSETSVSVTVDKLPGGIDGRAFGALVERLGAHGHVEVRHPCAVLSIVGRRLRTALAQLGSALSAFGERPVHLITQSTEDMNFSFVVDENDAPALVERLHAALFSTQGDDDRFGATWELLLRRSSGAATALSATPNRNLPHAERGTTALHREPWWRVRRSALLRLVEDGKPRFAYDLETMVDRAWALRHALTSIDDLFYAVKANAHPRVLGTLWEAGLGFECVSAAEVIRVRGAFGDGTNLLFTPNFCPLEEYETAFAADAEVTIDGAHVLAVAPELFRGREVALRIDPGAGRGHHEKVKTAGAHAKFGLPAEEVESLLPLLARLDVRVSGLHAHVGSGILDPASWASVGEVLLALRHLLPDLRWIDLGGGLGVPERPGQSPLDLTALEQALGPLRQAAKGLRLRLEPGRFLVSEAGVLLAPVTQVRRKAGVGFIGLATGMNSLLRPALYGAWHTIHNLTRIDEEASEYWHVVGPICESSDVLGRDRLLPDTHPGDVILIENAGAYGAVMSSSYNLRAPAEEVALEP